MFTNSRSASIWTRLLLLLQKWHCLYFGFPTVYHGKYRIVGDKIIIRPNNSYPKKKSWDEPMKADTLELHYNADNDFVRSKHSEFDYSADYAIGGCSAYKVVRKKEGYLKLESVRK